MMAAPLSFCPIFFLRMAVSLTMLDIHKPASGCRPTLTEQDRRVTNLFQFSWDCSGFKMENCMMQVCSWGKLGGHPTPKKPDPRKEEVHCRMSFPAPGKGEATGKGNRDPLRTARVACGLAQDLFPAALQCLQLLPAFSSLLLRRPII